jgi:LysM repeat protein
LSSLREHLLTTQGHGRLPFRGDCPLCTAERLRGSIAPATLVPRRAQAGLAAAVLLASSAAGPASALAQREPDAEREGHAPDAVLPGEVGGDQAIDPEFDPGAGLQSSPDQSFETPEPVEENEAVEGDALVDPVAIQERQEDAGGPSGGGATSEVGADRRVPPPAPEPVAAPAPSVEPHASPPAVHLAEPTDGKRSNARSAAYGVVVERSSPTSVQQPPSEPSAPSEPTPSPTLASAQPVPPTDRQDDRRPAARNRHVVQPGETLWSIARGRLGPDASTAAIAREVDRLWELNADSIGTGDPNLIVAGQVLILR